MNMHLPTTTTNTPFAPPNIVKTYEISTLFRSQDKHLNSICYKEVKLSYERPDQ